MLNKIIARGIRLLIVGFCRSEAVVRAPDLSLDLLKFPTSLFAHYGLKQTASPYVRAPAVFLSSSELCGGSELSSVTKQRVSRAIVITETTFSGCFLEDKYARLIGVDALALIQVEKPNPPGIGVFRRHQWFGDEFEGSSMLALSMSLDEETLHSIRQKPSLELIIEPPFDTRYADAFKSSEWTAFMRVIAPALALAASSLAFREAATMNRTRQVQGVDTLSVGFVVCAVEAPCLFLIALVMLLGQFGPMMLPLHVHYIFASLLSGTSVVTSALVALYLREECRPAPQRRSVWLTYKWLICICAVVRLYHLKLPFDLYDISLMRITCLAGFRGSRFIECFCSS